MKEITIKELKKMSKEQYRLVDIRNESNTIYGIIPGAINIPADKFEEADEPSLEKLDKDLMTVVYCQHGEKSKEIAKLLEDQNQYKLSFMLMKKMPLPFAGCLARRWWLCKDFYKKEKAWNVLLVL